MLKKIDSIFISCLELKYIQIEKTVKQMIAL